MEQTIDIGHQATGALPLASKNVLLVTCMDLRLLDDIVRFMDGENLNNRYDQFISAGASLSLMCPPPGGLDTFACCRHAFYDHLELAVALHQVKYVYVVEHMDCGTYKYDATPRGPTQPSEDLDSPHDEPGLHKAAAHQLRTDILAYTKLKQDDPIRIPERTTDGSAIAFRVPGTSEAAGQLAHVIEKIYQDRYLRPPHSRDWKLEVFTFLMDLRGQVELLEKPGSSAARGPKSRPVRASSHPPAASKRARGKR